MCSLKAEPVGIAMQIPHSGFVVAWRHDPVGSSPLAAAPLRRWVQTLATGGMLAMSSIPFVALAPEPPAFGRGAVLIVFAVAVLAILGTVWRAGPAQRAATMHRAAAVLAVTLAAAALRILAAGHVAFIPTTDLIAQAFGLRGEDVDDAFLYEVWLEIWLACAAALIVGGGLRRALRQPRAVAGALAGPWDRPTPPPLPRPRWNAATILLFLIGLGALGGAVVNGHWTASFLADAVHVTGTIADPQPHPLIRFTTAEGAEIRFSQNGFVSRPLGAEVPVAYRVQDPAGTAQADTFWANWSNMLGMLWIGSGFTLAPFFGFRAAFQAGRW